MGLFLFAAIFGISIPSASARPVTQTILTQDLPALHDVARDRTIPLRVYLPASDGKFPVIIFSHGLFMNERDYQTLAKGWARAGYVVILPRHTDAPVKDIFLQAQVEDLIHRPEDIHFLLGELSHISEDQSLRGKMDLNQVGMAGHSMGAYTTMAIAGAGVYLKESSGANVRNNFANSVPEAFLAISPLGEGKMGLTEESWSSLRGPILFMRGSEDRGIGLFPEPATWRDSAFLKAPLSNKFGVVIQEARHMTFTGRDLRLSAARELDRTLAVTTAFWDATLKQRVGAFPKVVPGVDYLFPPNRNS